MKDSGTHKIIQRFPRLTTGRQAAAFTKVLWATPEFKARFEEKSQTIQFVFNIPIQKEFRTRCPTAYRMIFRHFDLVKAFDAAFRDCKYGGKRLEDYITVGLHKAFTEALEVWLQQSLEAGKGNRADAANALVELKSRNRPRPG